MKSKSVRVKLQRDRGMGHIPVPFEAEAIIGAKKPETRARRIEKTLRALADPR